MVQLYLLSLAVLWFAPGQAFKRFGVHRIGTTLSPYYKRHGELGKQLLYGIETDYSIKFHETDQDAPDIMSG